MKKTVSLIATVLSFGVLSGIASSSLANYGVHPAVSTLALFAVLLVAGHYSAQIQTPFVKMADPGIDVVMWAKEIIKRLFKDNAYLNYSRSENQFVIGGMAVLIPQPGAKPNVVKNRGSFPAVAVRRTDTTVNYLLDEYSTDPTHITLNELKTISYDKISSIITDHFGYLLENVADDMLIKWANALPATNVIKTTGASTLSLETGQVGYRKAFSYKDLSEAQRVMNKANVSKDGRVALLEENMYQQLLDSLSQTAYKDFSRAMDEGAGKVPRLFGFDIITRSSVITAAADFSSGLTPTALGGAIGATDNVGCLCWQRETVASATGNVNLFSRTNDPLYYGDINSVSMRAGGRVRRADSAGIVAIMQDTADGAN